MKTIKFKVTPAVFYHFPLAFRKFEVSLRRTRQV